MSKKWEGKSRGTILGYKIFVFILKTFGVRSAYFVLYFVAFYFLLFSVKGSKSSYYYFRKRLKYSPIKSVFNVYKTNFVFGQTILDRVTIASGLKNQFTYEFDGEYILKEMLQEKKGGILISAHVGNFEIAEHFLNEIDVDSQFNLVTTDQEHKAIKEFLEKVASKSNLKFIIVKEDLSHIFEINNALSNNELIVFTGDRFFEGTKTLKATLLGKEAEFPAGPFLLGSRLKVPVAYVYVMKETAKHYHSYTRRATFENRNAQDLLENYTQNIEWILNLYPTQWFNFFDFWNDMD